MYWSIVFVFFFLVLMVSRYSLKKLKSKGVQIHRWFWAAASFLVMIIPNALLPSLSDKMNILLYALCAVFAVNFMIEQKAHVDDLDNRYPIGKKTK